jgi:hypothetical protein
VLVSVRGGFDPDEKAITTINTGRRRLFHEGYTFYRQPNLVYFEAMPSAAFSDFFLVEKNCKQKL